MQKILFKCVNKKTEKDARLRGGDERALFVFQSEQPPSDAPHFGNLVGPYVWPLDAEGSFTMMVTDPEHFEAFEVGELYELVHVPRVEPS